MRKAKSPVFALLIGAALVSAQPAISASDDDTAACTPKSSELSQLQSKEKLEGQVSTQAHAAERALRDFRIALKHFRRAVYNVFSESTRQDMIVVAEPDVIGPMIMPAAPAMGGILPGGYLPPRRKWLEHFVSQAESLLPLLKSEIEAITLPAEASKDALFQIDELRACADKLPAELEKLKAVSSEEKLDNVKIAKQAQSIENHIDAMKKIRKKLYKSMRKEEGHSKKEERDIERKVKKIEREQEKQEKQERDAAEDRK